MQETKNFGVGTDIESIDRFKMLDVNKDKVFLNKVFTRKELKYSFSKKDAASHLAARYAGKEAVIKALSGIGKAYLDYKKVEIFNNKKGVPLARINNKGYENLKLYLSLSHCRDTALAFAVAMEINNE